MIGQIAIQPVQQVNKLGSVNDKQQSGSSFGALLSSAGQQSGSLLTGVVENDGNQVLQELAGILDTDDLKDFMKSVEEIDPMIQQLFSEFSKEELAEMNIEELFMAASVDLGLLDSLSETINMSELEGLTPADIMAVVLSKVLAGEEESNPEKRSINVMELALLELKSHASLNPAQDLAKTSTKGQNDLLKMVLMMKGLLLSDSKAMRIDNKTLSVQNVENVLEQVQTILKTALTTEKSAFKPMIFSESIERAALQNGSTEMVKTEATAISIQSLQLQSGPVKWSLPIQQRQPDQAQQLMQQFQNIMKRSQFGKINGTEKLMIRLQPEHLGTLKIELIQRNGIMTARIMASTAVAKEMIDSQLSQLKQSFVNQNLQVEKIEIQQMPTGEMKQEKQPSDQSGQSQKQHDEQQQEANETEEGQSFHDIFLNIEV
ncbi:flagellar hook-length control protein FliK [Jeotgalibacillus sp. R-1-5s-1]|uniref:flagellar hook-length control protein FliK n=1 Tax=Jeotgalibacillus sp. R-1-5s-1 TaxID=2555897 RepID=UPI00106C5115|nr:flagellar hook-length control protein FliK [Jeotgalibacillus sp. R-1-5s-1]TFE03495.1 flagellar hook-length control protein FliK [Jeotgalibacillus sp. R-1-5s-1]